MFSNFGSQWPYVWHLLGLYIPGLHILGWPFTWFGFWY